MMKRRLVLWGCSLCMAGTLCAQSGDPVVMRINGKDVSRSEFEYNYNKNNGENVVDKKSVDEYVDMFVNYKLKVEAAMDAQYDTLPSYKKEFKSYRDQQIRPHFVADGAEENEYRKYYDQMSKGIGPDGLIRPAHILIQVSQKADAEEQERAKTLADSIYTALKQGADFAELAKQYTADRNTASRGGDLGGWFYKGQTVKEFEEVAFSLKKGEISEPFQTPFGYHIVLMKDRKPLESYEELKPQIKNFMDRRGLQDHIAAVTIDSMVQASGGTLTEEDVLKQKEDELCKADSDLKYLIQEYHDGLLLYEISTREVWDKAAKDTLGLEAYFAANKKKYKWDEPRYKGVVYHCKDEALVKKVSDLLKSVDESQWTDTLRATFNRDSVRQIRAEKSLFKKGDNAFVDNLVFGEKEKPKELAKYPYTSVYGRKLKSPEVWSDVKGELIADYQNVCEDEFVRKLRETYKVEIFKEALNTVNSH